MYVDRWIDRWVHGRGVGCEFVSAGRHMARGGSVQPVGRHDTTRQTGGRNEGGDDILKDRRKRRCRWMGCKAGGLGRTEGGDDDDDDGKVAIRDREKQKRCDVGSLTVQE